MTRAGKLIQRDATQLRVTAGCVIIALALMALVVHRRSAVPAKANSRPVLVPISDSRRALTADSYGIGSPTAPIVLVEFSDFQCPYCARMASTLDSLIALHHDSIRVVYRHLPLTSIHPMALQAAMAAECAGAQGRFQQMYHTLFSNQAAFADAAWISLAAKAQVGDSVRFERCMRDPEVTARVRRDVAAGAALGVRGTPSLIIGNIQVRGAAPLALLDSLISAGSTRKSPRSGS